MLQRVYKVIMIEKDIAIKIQGHALRSIESLHDALTSAVDHCSVDDFELIRRGVGIAIGDIQMDILEVIYQQYPDLDHLR
jgi:hypothetical protein